MKRIWITAMPVVAAVAIVWDAPPLLAGEGGEGEGTCQEAGCTRDTQCDFVWDEFLQATIGCPPCNGSFSMPGVCWWDN